MKLQELLETLIKALVEHPEDVRLATVDGERTTVFELRCHQEDIGKVIGKNGRTVSAIRTLLTTAAARQNKKAVLEVVD